MRPKKDKARSLRDFDVAVEAAWFITRRYRLSLTDIEGHCREWRFVWPRWLLIMLIHRNTSMPINRIGVFVGRSQEGIKSALRGLNAQVETDFKSAREVAEVATAFSEIYKP